MEAAYIYFDMDGVLADFDGGAAELCGLPREALTQEPGEQEEAMWAAIRQAERFYDRLKPLPGALELFGRVRKRYGDRCRILTGIPKPHRGIPTAGEDKRSWVRRLLGAEVAVHIVFKEEKPLWCTGPGCILIDDLPANISAWQAAGGTGILHRDPATTQQRLEELGLL